MINFTVGPVQMSKRVREIGGEEVPYFRTSEFSEVMLENERMMKSLVGAEENARAVFLTGSGTAAMEAAVINTLGAEDKVLVINGGGFGKRFVELCEIHNLNFTEIKMELGKDITRKQLDEYVGKGYTALLVNIHETSTGVHYNLDLLAEFCRENHIFLIVDAISSFLVDELDMKKSDIGLVLTGSQKALACPPGVSILVLSPEALKRIKRSTTKCMYLDLKNALINMERGQTPFTPAVGVMRQINERLREIEAHGGAMAEIARVKSLAEYFRGKIKGLPFEMVAETPSNGVTALYALNSNASEIFAELKDNYGIWICPNGGELKDKIFRVGHIGNLTFEDYDKLFEAFEDLKIKGKL